LRKGFTLIELLVVIGIVGLMVSMSAAAIFSARNKRTAKTAADQVKNVIMEAHAYAISPKTNDIHGVAVGNEPVNIVIEANSIKVRVGTKDIINPVTIPSNVALSCWSSASPSVNQGLGTCLSFRVVLAAGTDSNTIGQTTVNPPNYIVATKNGTGEKYKITTGHLSGNVTITTP